MDIIGRFLFIVWIASGILTISFGMMGAKNLLLISGSFFVAPILIVLVYYVIKWVITGEGE